MTPAIRFEGVDVVFGRRPERAYPFIDAGLSAAEVTAKSGLVAAVIGAGLTVAAGEIVVLMGLSGSGKSTLLRTVNGLVPATRGRVEVDGGNVTGASAAELRALRRGRVAMVFQQFGLLPWRSVRENVALGLEIAGVPRREMAARVDAELALVGLSDWAETPVTALSGGMQQRVGLARAFATKAPILLMDEPFSALDPLIRRRLQDELLDLQAQSRRTILFVSHDLDEAMRIGNRIAVMEGGRIVQVGTPGEILARPASGYVADFVSAVNPLGVLTARDVMQPCADAPAGCAVVAETTPVREVIAACVAGGGTVGVAGASGIVGRIDAGDVLRGLMRK
jgi:glycine betaine/proline transport system ATP-binding protein